MVLLAAAAVTSAQEGRWAPRKALRQAHTPPLCPAAQHRPAQLLGCGLAHVGPWRLWLDCLQLLLAVARDVRGLDSLDGS